MQITYIYSLPLIEEVCTERCLNMKNNVRFNNTNIYIMEKKHICSLLTRIKDSESAQGFRIRVENRNPEIGRCGKVESAGGWNLIVVFRLIWGLTFGVLILEFTYNWLGLIWISLLRFCARVSRISLCGHHYWKLRMNISEEFEFELRMHEVYYALFYDISIVQFNKLMDLSQTFNYESILS